MKNRTTKEFEILLNKMMNKKKKMSGRDFVKLVFLSGWDTGEKECHKKVLKLIDDLKYNSNDLLEYKRRLKQKIKELK